MEANLGQAGKARMRNWFTTKATYAELQLGEHDSKSIFTLQAQVFS